MGITIDIIVVNWNSGEKTLKAIMPYVTYNNPIISYNIIIVDNNSSDRSIEILNQKVGKIIVNKSNLGFSKACNKALMYAKGSYILLLNPDTESKPEVLNHLLSVLESNKLYAIAGPQQIDENGNIVKNCGRIPTFSTALFEITSLSKLLPAIFKPSPFMSEWNHKESRIVDHVIGSYMLIRRSIIDELGFLDERFFLYFEDLDFSKRVKDAGYFTYFDSTYSIIHEGGNSGDQISTQRLLYSFKSRREFWKKYFTKLQVFILTGMLLTVEAPLRLIHNVFSKDSSFKQKDIFIAYFLLLKGLFNKKEP